MSRTSGAPPPERLPPGGMVYYGHPFYVTPEGTGVVAGTSRYEIDFCAAIWKDNIGAVQFHPEESRRLGRRLIERFGNWRPLSKTDA